MRTDNAPKIQQASSERTATKTAASSAASKLPPLQDSKLAFAEPPETDVEQLDPADLGPDIPADAEALFAPSDAEDDTTDFHKIVDADKYMVENATILENTLP